MMERLGELLLCNKCLESSLQELFNSKSEDVIELSLFVTEETELHNSSDKGITLKKSSWIILVQGHELSCGLSEFSQSELDSPNLSLVLKGIRSDKLKLIRKSFLVEGLSWGL